MTPSEMQCCGTEKYSFQNNGQRLDFDYIVVNPYGSSEYQNALTSCFGEIGEYIFNDIAENDNLAEFDPNRRVDSIYIITALSKPPPALMSLMLMFKR